MEQEQKKPKKKSLTPLFLLILIGVCAGMGYYIFTMNQQSQRGRLARDEEALGGMLPGKTPQEISEILNTKVEEGMVNIGIENIEANQYSFQVNLVLDETGETIYSSGLIDPGYYVEYVELNQELQAGDHLATAVFTTYSLDESEDKIAEARVKLTLHVLDGLYYR